jgi:hypothetical protein
MYCHLKYLLCFFHLLLVYKEALNTKYNYIKCLVIASFHFTVLLCCTFLLNFKNPLVHTSLILMFIYHIYFLKGN